jgi:DNA helicase-2/ATP-dependent DNA helicase PcrA
MDGASSYVLIGGLTMESKDYRYETFRLKTVLNEIEKQIKKGKDALELIKETQITAQKTAWDELPRFVTSFDDLVEISTQVAGDKSVYEYYRLSQNTLGRLEKMALSPYFARIDFSPVELSGTAAGGEANSLSGQANTSFRPRNPIQVYIGISSLRDSETGQYLVYDWRAPVSGMFYDCELGPASYVAPSGVVSGELLLKRQFRISNGKLILMFDSSLRIDDEILQEVLARSSSGKLRTIVYTIQREQNRIIRDEANKVLIVQGPAGSGKTQIALHRAAYLLYRQRRSLSPKHIVIFSPNQIFSDYISGVLPELGEHNVGQTTFVDYARDRIPEAIYVEDANDQIEYVLSKEQEPEYSIRVSGIKLKSSQAYLNLIKAYPAYLEESLEFQDIIYNGALVASKKQLWGLMRREYSYLPLFRRIDKIKRRVLWLLEPIRKQRISEIEANLSDDPKYAGFLESDLRAISRQRADEELSPVKDHIRSWNFGSTWDVYRRFFKDTHVTSEVLQERGTIPADLFPWAKVCTWTLKMLNARVVPYEDIAPFLLLKGLLEGFPEPHMRHVIIDEAQDYTIAQYEVIRHSFPAAGFTILGDPNQATNPHMNTGNYMCLDEVFGDKKPAFVRLRNSYRSTRQIADFCQAILPGEEKAVPLDRPGSLPKVIHVEKCDELLPHIENDIHSLLKQGFKSIALICKTAPQSKKVYNELKARVKQIRLLTGADRSFQTGIVVLPSYLAKGLEFDAVIACNTGKDQYSRPGGQRLLYTVCTRALHRLHLYYTGESSPFLPSAGSGLYKHVSN